MDERLIFYLYYYRDENLFIDDDGHVVYDLFTMITPQNLFMFRHDEGYNTFPMVGNSNILCEIIPIPDEVCGWQELFDIDVGDDYERIERYELAKLHGCFI